MNVNIDLEINSWVSELDDVDRELIINKFLKLGYSVSSLCKTNIEYDNVLFGPVQKSLDDLSERQMSKLDTVGTQISENLGFLRQSIDKLTQFTSKSVSKGFYGEKYVEDLLRQYFPNYTVINNTHNPHKSDFEIQNVEGNKFMIEVKNYTNNVPTTEVNKFLNDLEQSDIQVGILLSLNSGIVKKKRFEIDNSLSGKKIIYLPNIKEDYNLIIMAILMSESLLKSDLQTKCTINHENLNIIFEELTQFNKHYVNIIENVKKSKHTMDKILQDMMTNLIEEDIKIKSYFQSIQLRIYEELQLSNSKFMTIEHERLLQIIDGIVSKNIKEIYYDIYQWCIEKDILIEINEIEPTHWNCKFFETKIKSKKVILLYQQNEITVHNFKSISKIFI